MKCVEQKNAGVIVGDEPTVSIESDEHLNTSRKHPKISLGFEEILNFYKINANQSMKTEDRKPLNICF